jgi:hypothetical protein
MISEGSLPCWQQPVRGPYPEPEAHSSHSHILFLRDPLGISYYSEVAGSEYFEHSDNNNYGCNGSNQQTPVIL